MSSSSSYDSNALKAELHGKGGRMTPQREKILKFFQELPSGEHLSAEALHAMLEDQEAHISISTVYRTLKLMSQMGILRELDLGDDYKYYELNGPRPNHHHHLICTRCNKVIEFKNDSILTVGSKVTNKEGFQLLDCQLLIHGICPTCQRSIV
jgi:Fur family transcriptional regulator, ferric uptake regulator